ncbi:MAG: RNA-directed DNA polymerase [Bacteroidaceae bacterium]|nr:RNA-directed DNA polymerase [Bacteroidaceae bacterium]
MSKRYGHLIPLIIERSNMDRAFDEVVDQLPEKEKRLKNGQIITLPGRRTYYRKRREDIIARLTRRIADGSFRVEYFEEMEVKDGPKVRTVQSPCVEDRIGCNAIMRIVEDKLYPSVIKTSAASIPGRGMHHLFAKMRRDIEHDPEGTRFFYKCDIRKFFESIDQDVMWQCIVDVVKDPTLLPILHNFITLMPHGLSIGLRSSQCFGNIILSAIDHYFKDVLGVKYYYRYCDDIVILSSSKRKLWMLRDIMHEKVAELGLQIKPNEVVRPITEGIDFLGFVYDGKKARLRKRTKQKAARKLSKLKSRKRRQEIIGSLKGMAKWGDCKNLYKTLTGKNMTDIGEIKAEVKYQDGKKRFRGSEISPRELAGKPFIIVDFERDLIPRREKERYQRELRENNGDSSVTTPPKKKWLVSIIYNGEPRKMWTGMMENKAKLEEAEKNGQIPSFSSIHADYSGKVPCYTFCSAVALGFTMPSDEEVEQLIRKFNMR